MGAVIHRNRYGYLIEMDGLMKAVVYGVCETTEGFNCVTPINYVKDVNQDMINVILYHFVQILCEMRNYYDS